MFHTLPSAAYLLKCTFEQVPEKIVLQETTSIYLLVGGILFCLNHGIQHIFVHQCILGGFMDEVKWSAVDKSNAILEQNHETLTLHFLHKDARATKMVHYLYPKLRIVYSNSFERFFPHETNPFFGETYEE